MRKTLIFGGIIVSNINRCVVGHVRAPRSRAQALVEFALVMTVLLPMLVGVADVGRMFYQSIIIHEAAQAGAQVAAVTANMNSTCPSSGAQSLPSSISYCGNKLLYQAIMNSAPSWFPIADTDITITPADPTAWTAGETFTITVAKTFNYITPVLSSTRTQTLRARVTGTRCNC